MMTAMKGSGLQRPPYRYVETFISMAGESPEPNPIIALKSTAKNLQHVNVSEWIRGY